MLLNIRNAIPDLIEYILSTPLRLEFIFISTLIIYFTGIRLLKKFNIFKEDTFTLSTIVVVLLSSITFAFGSNTSTTFVIDSDWKTIYTNDQNATITLKNYDNIRYIDLSLPYTITAGKELSKYYDIFNNRSNDWNGYIMAEKDGDTVTRPVILHPENIISSSKITEKSKITKIEYRKISGYYKKLGSYQGRFIPYDRDEIRVTIGENHQETLNKLFDN